MQTLNLGILAHVDAGKTSLTERLLYAAGAIDALGSVDSGDTQTDTLDLERRRGITIKAAVAPFVIRDQVHVNLIDTPGHPDFIAEVERVLRVLDGALLVVSAVEGVQPQTRVLMRALTRVRVPTLLFVNKIDRVGAREASLSHEISELLGLTTMPMGSTSAIGSPQAEFTPWAPGDLRLRPVLAEVLAVHDERTLIEFVEEDGRVPLEELAGRLRAQTEQCLVQPVFFGSARTGAGIGALLSGIAQLLPPATGGDPEGPVSGTVFKIERGEAGEKIAYVRMYSGTLRIRDRIVYGTGREDRVTDIAPFDHASSDEPRRSVSGGNIARIRGLREVEIGDRVGQVGTDESERQFTPPTIESVVEALDPADQGRLRVALGELSEQDPFIEARQDDTLGELSVSLYGEVQKEVIESTLADNYGLAVAFRGTTTIYVERPVRRGAALELLNSDANPYMATLGLRVEPGPVASGTEVVLDVDERSVPLYIYKTQQHFVDHMTQYVCSALRRGLYGWEVIDCLVTITECDYYIGDGPAKPTVPMARTTSSDFRGLAPLVLRAALGKAGTRVCEPMLRLDIEVPSRTIGGLLHAIGQLGGSVEETGIRGTLSTVGASMTVDRARVLQTRLSGLTGGEGNVEAVFEGYRPVRGGPVPRGSTSARRGSS